MSAVGWLVASLPAATPSPSPSDVLVSESTGGSPGFLGFVFTFALAVACVGIFLSLTRQLRRVDRRAKQLEAREQGASHDGEAAAPGAVDGDEGAEGAADARGVAGTRPAKGEDPS